MAKFEPGEHVFAGDGVPNKSGWGSTKAGTPGRIVSVNEGGFFGDPTYDVKFDNGEVVSDIPEKRLEG